MDIPKILEQILEEVKSHSIQLQVLDVMQADIATLKSDVAELKTDVATLKSDVAELKTDVTALKSDVFALKTEVATLKVAVSTLKAAVSVLETNMDKVIFETKVLTAEMNTASEKFGQIESDILVLKGSVLNMENRHETAIQLLLEQHEPNSKKHFSHTKRLSTLEKTVDGHSIQLDYLMNSK